MQLLQAGFPFRVLWRVNVADAFVFWGRIHGRNCDKSLKSFPPCYSQSPLLTDFTPLPPPPPGKSGLKLVCEVNIVYPSLKSENSQETHKPQRNCTFMYSASGGLLQTSTFTDVFGNMVTSTILSRVFSPLLPNSRLFHRYCLWLWPS